MNDEPKDGIYYRKGEYYVRKDEQGYYVCDTDGIAEGEDLEHDHIDRYGHLDNAIEAAYEADRYS